MRAQRETKTCMRLTDPDPRNTSEPLSAALGAGRHVYLKMDALQPPGSFKIRGIGLTIARAVAKGAERVVSSSGGNAGLAAAYCARALGVDCTVVVPQSTPYFIVDRLRAYGAEAMVHGSVWDEANTKAVEICGETNGCLVHPFDQSDTWDGHATLVRECQEQFRADLGKGPEFAPSAFVTCVGGGGLLMGILRGLDEVGWASSPVVACETEGADSMAQALVSGKLVTLPGIASIAKSLGATRVSEEIFNHCRSLGPERVRPWVCTDRDAVEACARFADDHRVLVEPACGAALASIYGQSPALEGCESVVVEVCGGAIVDRQMLEAWCISCGAFNK